MFNLRNVSALQRLVLCALLAAMGLAVSGAPGFAADKSAAMVIDANTGRVLYAQNADAERYPASLTKMMTLFMVFDELRAGRLTLSSRITMSKTAAQRPPSKLGLKPGQSLSLEEAIKVLVTKSANDVAAAIGEHIAGSEWRFAARMTDRARQLGMKSTTFRNASGLPDSQQKTTARDILTLALALYDIYPEYYHFFATRTAYHRGKTYRTHNTLLRSMRGVDGIKTGYTRASGFNVVTSMRHNGRHVIGAVFGGRTASSRNARMRSLIYTALKKASPTKTRRAPPQLIARPATAPRPAVTASKVLPPPKQRPQQPRAQAAAAAPQPAGIEIARVKQVSVLDPAPGNSASPWAQRFANQRLADQPRVRQPSTLNAQAARLNATAVAVASASAPKPTYNLNGPRTFETRPPAPRGPFQIQVGAFTSAEEAERHVEKLKTGLANALNGYAPLTLPAIVNGRQYWRVRFAGFDAPSASNTCNELRRNSVDCFVAQAP